MKKSYPISLKIAVIVLCMFVTMVVVFAATPEKAAKPKVTNLTPDSKLPWGGSIDEVEVALNVLYKAAAGMPIQLCESQLESVYAMCIVDDETGEIHGSHMIFQFKDGQLAGYRAKFDEKDLKDIISSAKFHYKDASHGKVSSRTRTFYIYEKELKKDSWNELYIVHDRIMKKVRVQSRFIKDYKSE